MQQRLRFAEAFLILLLVLTGCAAEPTPTPIVTAVPEEAEGAGRTGDVTASGTVVSAREVQLSFATPGRADEIAVAVGDTVGAGQPLIRLDATELEANIAQAEAAQVVAERERARLDAPPHANAVASAEAHVRAAEAAVSRTLMARNAPIVGVTDAETSSAQSVLAAARADRQETFEVYRDRQEVFQYVWWNTEDCIDVGGRGRVCLPVENARLAWRVAEAKLDAAEAEVSAVEPRGLAEARTADADIALARAQHTLAQAQLAQVTSPVTAEEIATADAAVAEARAAVRAARAALDRATLEASMEGTVVDVEVERGEIVRAGQTVVTLADLGRLSVVTTDLSELDVPRVAPGQTVTLFLEAFGGRQVKGQVQRIAGQPALLGGDVVYDVFIDLDEIPRGLRLGMSVEVTIHVE